MTYDWEKTVQIEPYSREWFDEINRRFFESSYYAQDKGQAPFSRFMPESAIRGMRVLEIGCGMGSHAELLTRRGANLTAIDQTSFATRAREAVRRLVREYRSKAPLSSYVPLLPENEFDLVWAWGGVIHHSRSTETIVKNIARVLKPGGSLLFMVYYRPSLVYWLHCAFIRGVLAGQLPKKKPKSDLRGFVRRLFRSDLHEKRTRRVARSVFPRHQVHCFRTEGRVIPDSGWSIQVGHRKGNSRPARAIRVEPLGINDFRASQK